MPPESTGAAPLTVVLNRTAAITRERLGVLDEVLPSSWPPDI